MNRTRLPAITFGLIALVSLDPNAVRAQEGSAADAPFTWSGPMRPGTSLTIRNFNGRIDVRAGTGDRAEVRAERGSRRAAADLTFVARNDGGDVSVCSVWRGHSACDRNGDWDRGDDHDGRDTRATITVTLPRGVALRGGTGNGAVTVEGTGGDVSISTGNGDVRLSGTSGTVKASSGNGELDVSGAAGSVTASTGNGRVRVATGAGPVRASTGNGDITVDMRADPGAQDMSFTTGHGDISVTVPGGINADFDASTGWGSIHTDFPIRVEGSMNPRHIRGTIGRGGQRIHMSTGVGTIELRKGS
ncbi:MAG: DUF4097 family beta strand repeat protein [Gemmatimonadota bacterium]|nr:DUF4097 family beta strand repeat protein [Gemmatimonadota bacterium]MDE3127434.1 DUF4097 family beta strand repeat protein [Gemmatimonadota bacterium]MDE3217100.1 DUF4097 family beta strand repeat protein [Gemmatimonadota bacterium]